MLLPVSVKPLLLIGNMETQQRTIVVTGASRGIGAAIVMELVRRGFVVGCLSRGGTGPEEGADALSPSAIIPVACDVRREEDVKMALSHMYAKTGGIHGIVNNAGIHRDAPSAKLSIADYEQVMNTNATAVMTACREVYPFLLKAGGGTIVNMGSFFDKIGVKRNLAYCASKAAVGAMTRCLAVEWASKSIRVLNVAPGYIETDLNREAFKGPLREFLSKRIPGGQHGGVGDVAKLVASIFSENIAFLSGETIYIDGAQGVAH